MDTPSFLLIILFTFFLSAGLGFYVAKILF